MKKQLDFSRCRFYGRAKEVSTLLDAYHKSRSGSSELVLINGYSGTGKSTLVNNLRDKIINEACDNELFFVTGKFDLLCNSKPYSALTQALDELCEQILALASIDELEHIKETIIKYVGLEGIQIISNVIPKLQRICQHKMDGNSISLEIHVDSKAFMNRFHIAFRSFVRAIATPSKPFVVFLDDLQWADNASLDLMTSLITDKKSRNILFIGSYRDNEVDDCHPLSSRISDIEKRQTSSQITSIHLGDLNEKTVNELIADITEMNKDETSSLARVVYDKTRGNVLFVIQFLKLLQDEELLRFCFRTFKWTFDVDLIRAETTISDNVVDLIACKIKRLPEKVMSILTLASFLGSYFDVDALEAILDSYQCGEELRSEDVAPVLDAACNEGLLDSRGHKMYKFSHDRIQQSAYSLIPEGQERDKLHLNIGERISKMKNSPQGDEWILFVSVDQLNRAASHINDKEKRLDLAEKNLRAAQSAIKVSAFEPAANYVRSGIRLLSEKTKWQFHYNLSLQLHTKLAELETCNGSFAESRKHINKVLENSVCFDDKMPAYFTLVKSLNAEGKLQESLDAALSLLRGLGEPFPMKVNHFHLLADMMKTKQLLRGKSHNDIRELNEMTDKKKLAAMKLIGELYLQLHHLDQFELLHLMDIRMAQITLRYGLCEQSGIALVRYGMTLVASGDFEEGYRFGKLGVELSNPETDVHARDLFAFMVMHWREPLANTTELFLKANETGMATGKVHEAFIAVSGYVVNYIYSGLPLQPLIEDLEKYGQQAIEYNLNIPFFHLLPQWQFVLNLMGRSDDPVDLSVGEAMDKQSLLENHHKIGGQSLWSYQMQLAFYFNDLELAAELSKKIDFGGAELAYYFCARTLFFGLIAIALERRRPRQGSLVSSRQLVERPKTTACKMLKKMKRWVEKGAVNCVHKLKLLEAEYKSLSSHKRNFEELQKIYDEAISCSAKTGFLQDQALANELAGLRSLENGYEFLASSYLCRAYELYCEWNAHGKAAHLREQHQSLITIGGQKAFSSNLKARQTFSPQNSKEHHASIKFGRISVQGKKGV